MTAQASRQWVGAIVIGDPFPGGTVLEGLEVHFGESNGQALRFRQCSAGCFLQAGFVRDRTWCGGEFALLHGLEQLAFVVVQRVFDFSLFIGCPLEPISVDHGV
jgi:hypothetical protein